MKQTHNDKEEEYIEKREEEQEEEEGVEENDKWMVGKSSRSSSRTMSVE